MGIKELAYMTLGLQLSQALGAFLGKITPPPTNPWANAAVVVGQEFAANAVTAFQLGVDAASAEFATTQAQEATVAAGLQALPPIT